VKYTWEFFSGRRNLEISKFLKGAKNLEEAKQKFLDNQIIPPADSIILSVIVKDSPLTKAMKKRSSSDNKVVKTEKDDVPQQKQTTSKKSKQKKYFRKVLSPKTGESSE